MGPYPNNMEYIFSGRSVGSGAAAAAAVGAADGGALICF